MLSLTNTFSLTSRSITRTRVVLFLAAFALAFATNYAAAQSLSPRPQLPARLAAHESSQLALQSRSTAQRPLPPASQPARSCDVQRACTINPVFAIGMKCDGVTDDSAALQAALNGASDPALGNAKVILPPGTCIIDPASVITINSGLWLQGAGRYGTRLKRKDSSAGGALLTFNADGITLSDFAIDGNKGGTGITAPADSINVIAPSDDVAITRMRFLNATASDINSTAQIPGIFVSNWIINDNDFDNEGTSDCGLSILCGNILIHQPLNVKVLGNRSDSSQHFVLFSSVPGGGQVDVGNNVLTRLNGFGVALGGGPIGSAGAHIHHNFMSSLQSDAFNLIDVAIWYDYTVDHNILYHNGQATTQDAPTSCIADFPPAYHGVIDGNVCHATGTPSVNIAGISVGGDDVVISNNFVDGASGTGITYVIGAASPIRGVRIIGNTVKNNSQRVPGAAAGIELYLASNPPDLAGLSDVVISGNHSYDDQPNKTQGYGIGVTLFDKTTNIYNIVIENNDVAGNLNAGILNRSQFLTSLVIRNNFGYNPVGVVTPPVFPAPGGPITNTTGIDTTIYVTSGTSPVSVAINGVSVKPLTVPGGGVVGNPIRLPANQSITLSYTAGGSLAPSWQWVGD